MRSVKVGMIGLNNGHARQYFAFLLKSPMFDFVGVSVAPDQRGRAYLDMIPGVPVYASPEELLTAHPELEAMIIAGPNYQTLGWLELCLAHRLHVPDPQGIPGRRGNPIQEGNTVRGQPLRLPALPESRESRQRAGAVLPPAAARELDHDHRPGSRRSVRIYHLHHG